MTHKFFKTIYSRIKNLFIINGKDQDSHRQQQTSATDTNTDLNPETPPLTSQKRSSAYHKNKRLKVTEASPTSLEPAPSKNSGTNRKKWHVGLFQVPPEDGKLRFHDLGLPSALMHAIYDLEFQYCSPIQAEILPGILKGKDATGRAQTGTGKTAAFLIAIITRLVTSPPGGKNKRTSRPRALILAPTRELAMQITDEAKMLVKYTPLKVFAVFGGMDYEKQRQMIRGNTPDILVATPGRLIDFHKQRELSLKALEILVIDEADRMLDMGFIPDVRKIISYTPSKSDRQTLLFSATMAPEVIRLASNWTRQPIHVEIEPEQVAVDTVKQIVYITTTNEKLALLHYILTQQKLERVIIFCNRRDETRRLTDFLFQYGFNCAMISGEIAQKTRVKTLENFKTGRIKVLVATDVAGRGLHIEGISHVINYTLPHDAEDYVHRIGRTGRAGASGTSISFACEEDSFYIPNIEAFLGEKLNCIHPDESWLELPSPPHTSKSKRSRPPKQKRTTPSKSYHRRNRSEKSGNFTRNANSRNPKSKRYNSKPQGSKTK